MHFDVMPLFRRAFNNSHDRSLLLYFDKPGQPLILSIDGQLELTIDCVIATLSDQPAMSPRNISPGGVFLFIHYRS